MRLPDPGHSVSHLYRSLGERRVLQLVEMLALEPELLEPGAMALYRWSAGGAGCEPAPPGPKARYDYAAWLLRTVGGLTRDVARGLELLAGRDDLVFRDRYVEDLRAMRDRWVERTGGARR